MNVCKKCNSTFPNRIIIDGIERIVSSRKYCLDCSPFGKHNTQKLEALDDSPDRTCKKCGREFIYEGKYNSYGHRKNKCNSCKTQQWHKKKKLKAIHYKGGKCSRCGYIKYIEALCFHHENVKDKLFTIGGNYSRSWNVLQIELDKCILLCLNCHAEIHAEAHAENESLPQWSSGSAE